MEWWLNRSEHRTTTLFSANLLLSKMEPLYFVLHIVYHTLGVVVVVVVPFFKRESIKIKLARLSIYIPLFLKKKIFLDWRPDQIKWREECTLIRQKWWNWSCLYLFMGRREGGGGLRFWKTENKSRQVEVRGWLSCGFLFGASHVAS